MTKTHWVVGIIGVGIMAIAFGIIFMNPESEDISQTQILLEAQEDRLILLEQTINQLQGEVASLNGRLQVQEGQIQGQQQRIAEQRREIYQQHQQFMEAAQLVSEQKTLIEAYQNIQRRWQAQHTTQQDLLADRVKQLQSEYQSLPQPNLTRFPDRQSPRVTQTYTPTPVNQTVTLTNVDSSIQQSESASGVSSREYQKHLFKQQAELQRQRAKQDLRQLERTRQRQADLMQRVRGR
jgi:hypothetical protein